MILWLLTDLLPEILRHLPWPAKLWIICHIDRILACACFSAAWLIASLPTSPEK